MGIRSLVRSIIKSVAILLVVVSLPCPGVSAEPVAKEDAGTEIGNRLERPGGGSKGHIDNAVQEIINPGTSSGQRKFTVTGPTQPQPSPKGVDYSYDRPNPAGLKAAGYGFVIRYVGGSASKRITADEVQALQAAGLGIITVFEVTAYRMRGGYSAGVSDANTAVTQATAAGAPQDFFCYFACDFDAAARDQTAINAYLDGAASVLGGFSRVGFYGGYWPLKRVLDAGKATKGWQTPAWSGGNHDSRISLLQHAGEVSIAGGACDVNVAYGNDWGQWSVSPIDTSPPPVHAFNVEARSIIPGSAVTITCTVSDTWVSGLNRLEPWRANTYEKRLSCIRKLLDRKMQDVGLAETVAQFYRRVKRGVGALTAALGRPGTRVFAGGIGEHAPTVCASRGEPPYLIKSDTTDHLTMHTGSALKKLKSNQ
jgi:hypothetical protein